MTQNSHFKQIPIPQCFLSQNQRIGHLCLYLEKNVGWKGLRIRSKKESNPRSNAYDSNARQSCQPSRRANLHQRLDRSRANLHQRLDRSLGKIFPDRALSNRLAFHSSPAKIQPSPEKELSLQVLSNPKAPFTRKSISIRLFLFPIKTSAQVSRGFAKLQGHGKRG